mmetsp:Transcript_13389/g.14531  ORF Transcript_13389/g.14531 Transcript_13389/m.14531 type:complete len:585 (+) Transcript_13389:60-1814(+)
MNAICKLCHLQYKQCYFIILYLMLYLSTYHRTLSWKSSSFVLPRLTRSSVSTTSLPLSPSQSFPQAFSLPALRDNASFFTMLKALLPWDRRNSSLPMTSVDAIGGLAFDFVSNVAEQIVNPASYPNQTQRFIPITSNLRKIQQNMDILDNIAGKTPQLSRLELFALSCTVIISAIAPAVASLHVVEVLVPSMAAVSASISLSAEYVGRVAMSKSKEISALAIQAAAEAEVLLANAERAKAILPLCVGVSTTASAFALLAPNILHSISVRLSPQLTTEILLFFPLVSVLSAAIAGLAVQETRELAARASGLGSRRFASSTSVGKSWLSASEQVERSADRQTDKWKTFAASVFPAPVIGALCPGPLSFKCIVCAAIAASQSAFYLAIAEYFISAAVEAVALKARSSAVSDTYANQASRAGSILPFTSALAGLCAAASAAVVELLPLVHVVELQSALAAFFPLGASLFAAAATIAKAKCEVDEMASSLAASKGLSPDNPDGDQEQDPLNTVKQQILLSIATTWGRFQIRGKQLYSLVFKGKAMQTLTSWYRGIAGSWHSFFSRFLPPFDTANDDTYEVNTAIYYADL